MDVILSIYIFGSLIAVYLILVEAAGGSGIQATRHGRTAPKVSAGSYKPINGRSKVNAKGDSNSIKSVPQSVHV